MSKRILHPAERDAYGVIVSALVDGVVKTVHEPGLPGEALERAIWRFEQMGRAVQVLVVSTPESIYTDLKGSRNKGLKPNAGLVLPESQALTRVGRSDLGPIPLSETAWQRLKARIRREQRDLGAKAVEPRKGKRTNGRTPAPS